MIAYKPDMSKETVRKHFSTGFWHEKSATKLDRGVTLWNNFKNSLFIVSFLMMKHGVINMIPKPNASPWSVFLVEYKASVSHILQVNRRKWNCINSQI
jgi:hypothetical protein